MTCFYPIDEPEPADDPPKLRSWANIAHVSGGAPAVSTAAPASQQNPAFPSQAADASACSPDKPAPTNPRVNTMRNNRYGLTVITVDVVNDLVTCEMPIGIAALHMYRYCSTTYV